MANQLVAAASSGPSAPATILCANSNDITHYFTGDLNGYKIPLIMNSATSSNNLQTLNSLTANNSSRDSNNNSANRERANSSSINGGGSIAGTSSSHSGEGVGEENVKKRELRLLKNR